jgi:SWI/SNF-related matrix-associated actin-dependent regulator of chromatin subfamily A3
LSNAERTAYDELAASCKKSIQSAASGRPAEGNAKSILAAVLRLRMFCNTGCPVSPDKVAASEEFDGELEPDVVASLLQQSGDTLCADCNSDILLSMNPADAIKNQQGSIRRCLKCQGNAQQTSNVDETNNIPGDNQDPAMEAATYDAMEDVQYHEAGPAVKARTPASVRYPSKLNALLTDMKHHNLEEKR